MKEFKDKVLVVTGGSRGIGKAIAVEGAKRGMKIVLNDIDGDQLAKTCEEIKGMGVECIGQHADISLYENIEALLKLAMDSFGHVDMLVNNAGCAVSGAIWKLPKQDIDWITELNFLSHLYGMKIFLPQMIAQGTPCEIVNVESTAGLMTSGKATMYHATKAAGVAASESVYIAMKEQGYPIHIHCLVPAYVKTTIHLADLHDANRPTAKQKSPKEVHPIPKSRLRFMSFSVGIGISVFSAPSDTPTFASMHIACCPFPPTPSIVASPILKESASAAETVSSFS